MQVVVCNKNATEERGYKRSPNFSAEEVLCLLKLVQERKKIIFDERLDCLVKEGKDAAWKAIEAKFNKENSFFYRDIRSLKNKFQDVKTRYYSLEKSWRKKMEWKESEKILGEIINYEDSIKYYKKDFNHLVTVSRFIIE